MSVVAEMVEKKDAGNSEKKLPSDGKDRSEAPVRIYKYMNRQLKQIAAHVSAAEGGREVPLKEALEIAAAAAIEDKLIKLQSKRK